MFVVCDVLFMLVDVVIGVIVYLIGIFVFVVSFDWWLMILFVLWVFGYGVVCVYFVLCFGVVGSW